MANITTALRKIATKHANVEAGITCAGTAMERHTMKTNKKAFLFFGTGDAMLKLEASSAGEEAREGRAEALSPLRTVG